MGKAYSLDLRERVWRACQAGRGSQPQVAEQFGVSASFVRDLVRRVRETGSPRARPHGGGHPPALDAKGLEQLAQAVAAAPDATLEELVSKLRRERKLSISRTALWRSLQWLRLTRKKEGPARQRARQPSGAPSAARAS